MKKMKFAFAFLLSAALVAAGQFARAGVNSDGGFAGNGTENKKEGDEIIAWFVNDAKMRWCVDPANLDSRKIQYVKATFSGAVAYWRKYLELKKYAEYSGPRAALNPVELAHCDGTENLKIYFGVKNDEVNAALKRHGDPFGIAQLTHYDAAKGSGRGFIWLKTDDSEGEVPNWNNRYVLTGEFLHSLGHVLGCEHVKDTVMDPDFDLILMQRKGPSLLFPPEYYQVALSSIDFNKELFFAKKTGNQMWGYRGPATPELSEIFVDLVGRKPVGFLGVVFEQGDEERYLQARVIIYELKPGFQAPSQSNPMASMYAMHKLDIALDGDLPTVVRVSDAKIFHVVYGNSDHFLEVPGYMRTGVLTAPNGKKFEVSYFRNQVAGNVASVTYRNSARKLVKLFAGDPFQQYFNQ